MPAPPSKSISTTPSDGTTSPVFIDGNVATQNHLNGGGTLNLKGTVNFSAASRIDFTNSFGGQLTLQDNADVTFAAGMLATANINGTLTSAVLHNGGTISGHLGITGLSVKTPRLASLTLTKE